MNWVSNPGETIRKNKVSDLGVEVAEERKQDIQKSGERGW